ncbi:MAG: diguanylate cyclase [Gammaproteobacteria bacterium]|jgi:diguanylate cyclase (GGDEF)-like protein
MEPHTSLLPPRGRAMPQPLIFACVLCLYVGLAWFGIALAGFQGTPLALLWLPAGVAVAALILFGERLWPAVLLGSLIANTPFLLPEHGHLAWLKALFFGLGAATIDTMEALIAYRLHRHFIGSRGLASVESVVRFMLFVVTLPGMVGAFALVTLYAIGGFLPASPAGESHGFLVDWASISLADMHGIFIVVPLALAWAVPRHPDATGVARSEILGISIAIVVIFVLALFQAKESVFLLVPLAVWITLRTGLRGTSLFMLVMSLVLSIAALRGLGPFAIEGEWGSMTQTMLFIFSIGFAALVLVAQQRELREINHSLEDLIQERTQALHDLNEKLQEQANTDELTGLLNRRAFIAQAEKEASRAQRSGARFALLMLDIDDFKVINDTHGHAAGDAALRAVSECCRDRLRKYDLIARLGGEEFCILAPDTDMQGARCLAEDLLRHVTALRVRTPSGVLSLTLSIGLAPFEGDLDLALKHADEALYEAKDQGKNRLHMAGDT